MSEKENNQNVCVHACMCVCSRDPTYAQLHKNHRLIVFFESFTSIRDKPSYKSSSNLPATGRRSRSNVCYTRARYTHTTRKSQPEDGIGLPSANCRPTPWKWGNSSTLADHLHNSQEKRKRSLNRYKERLDFEEERADPGRLREV